VIKGFAHQKKFDQAWAVYEEMCDIESEFTTYTFNTLIDACARCGQFHRIPSLLAAMEEHQIKPDIITYGTALKGYCQEGDVDKSLELLQEMRETTDFKLDEMMYNSLLDGCGKYGRWERAKAILEEMLEAGMKPSNYTLCMMVKVGRRSTFSTDEVFTLAEESTCNHSIKPNVFFYNSLIQLCAERREWPRAFVVFSRLMNDGLRPDTRTYTVLLKSLSNAGFHEMSDAVLRAALGMSGAETSLLASAKGDVVRLRPDMQLPKPLIADVVDGMNAPLAAQLLEDMKAAGLQIDARVKMRLAARFSKARR